eukprot:scaffold8314_cov57-Attheya_sp.AAC.2
MLVVEWWDEKVKPILVSRRTWKRVYFTTRTSHNNPSAAAADEACGHTSTSGIMAPWHALLQEEDQDDGEEEEKDSDTQ